MMIKNYIFILTYYIILFAFSIHWNVAQNTPNSSNNPVKDWNINQAQGNVKTQAIELMDKIEVSIQNFNPQNDSVVSKVVETLNVVTRYIGTKCGTFKCILNQINSILYKNRKSFNLLEIVKYEFGDLAYKSLKSTYTSLRLNESVSDMKLIEFKKSQTEFMVIGSLLSPFHSRKDVEITMIFTAERDGYMSIKTGVNLDTTAPSTRKENSINRNVRNSDGNFLLVIASLFFQGKVPYIPLFNAKTINTKASILSVNRFRLIDYIAKNIEPIVERDIGSTFKMEGPLESLMPDNGIQILASLIFDHNCNGNYICEMVSKVIPKDSRLQVRFNPGYFPNRYVQMITAKYLYAGIGNIRLHPRLLLDDCSLFVSIKPYSLYKFAGMFTTGVTGVLAIEINKNDTIRLKGDIGQTMGANPKVEMFFAMIGMWHNPFNIPFVSFGNIQLKKDFDATTGIGKVLAFGGQIYLGKRPKNNEIDRRIKGILYLSINLGNPIDGVYFYASISNITVQSLLNQITDKIELPNILGSVGLVGVDGEKGVIASFSPFMDKQIPDVMPPVIIQRGFIVRGKMIFLLGSATFRVFVDFLILEVNIKIELSPINILDGRFQVCRSENEKHLGPILDVQASYQRHVKPYLYTSGYVNILGLSASINMNISTNGLIFKSEGKLWDTIEIHQIVNLEIDKKKVYAQGAFLMNGSFTQLIINGATAVLTGKTNRRRLFSFKKIFKKAVDVVKDITEPIVQHAEKVGKTVVSSGKNIGEGFKEISKGNVFGGLKRIASATIRAFIVMSPIGMLHFRIIEISYTLDVETARKKNFNVLISLEVGLLSIKRAIKLNATIDLDEPLMFGQRLAKSILRFI